MAEGAAGSVELPQNIASEEGLRCTGAVESEFIDDQWGLVGVSLHLTPRGLRVKALPALWWSTAAAQDLERSDFEIDSGIEISTAGLT